MSDSTDVAEVEERPETRLTLQAPVPRQGQADATVLVKWTITPDFVHDLERREFIEPALLLSVRSFEPDYYPNQDKMRARQDALCVVPLERGAQYVRFVRPGANEVRAMIVDVHAESARKQVKRLREHNGSIIDDDGTPGYGISSNNLKYVVLGGQLSFDVPQEMFAPPPSKWTKALVGRFWSGLEDDQCHFRRRLIVSSFAAILLLTVGQAVKCLLALLALVLGVRSRHWKDLFHPFKGSVFGPFEQPESSWWFWDKEKDDIRFHPFLILNPLVLFGPAAVAYAIQQWKAHGHKHSPHTQLTYLGWWDTVWRADLALICLVAALAVLAGILVGFDKFVEIPAVKQRLSVLRAKLEAWHPEVVKAELEHLAVQVPEERIVSYKTLDRKTVRLRYDHLKSKVCKPFAH